MSPYLIAAQAEGLLAETIMVKGKVGQDPTHLETEEKIWLKDIITRKEGRKLQWIGRPKHSKQWQLRLKNQDSTKWKRQMNEHILCFDGASKGN